MAEYPITQLANIDALASGDTFPVVDASEGVTANKTKEATIAQLLAFVEANADVTTAAELAAAIAMHEALADPHTGYQRESEKGAANGYASLDAGGKIPSAQIPAIALSEFLGTVASEAAMVALSGQRGDWCVRTDFDPDRVFILETDDSSQAANWTDVTTPGSVVSVNGQTGTVNLTATNIPSSATGDVAATNVQAAIAELASEKATAADLNAHLTDTSDAHDASAISIADAGGHYTGTDVEAALQEAGAVVDVASLPAAGDLDGTELIAAKQGAAAVKVTSEQLTPGPGGIALGAGFDRQRIFEDLLDVQDAVSTSGALIAPTGLTASLGGAGARVAPLSAGGEILAGHVIVGGAQPQTGTTTTGSAAMTKAAPYIWQQTHVLRVAVRLRIPTLSTGAEAFEVRAGLVDTWTGAPAHGLFIRAQGGDTNWEAVNVASSVATVGDLGVAIGTGYKTLLIRTDGSTVHYSVFGATGTLEGSLSQSTNRPAGPQGLQAGVGIFKSAGTTSRSLNVDAVGCDLPDSRGSLAAFR